MNNYNPTMSDFLALFNLQSKDIETCSISHQQDGIYVYVKLIATPQLCPICGQMTSRIKEYYTKKITHSIFHNTNCYIIYSARRYVCRRCHKTFYENNPFTMPSSNISLVTVYNILNDLKSPRETFTGVAIRYNVSPTTVTRIFDSHVHISRRKLPEYLCLDEVYSFKSYNSKYVCVLVDFLEQKIVDVLPSRKKNDLYNYFSAIPLNEREKVKICSFDMWESYRIICKEMFPNSVNSVDHFHMIQELNRCVDKVRIRIMNSYYKTKQNYKNIKNRTPDEEVKFKEASQHYYALKKFKWMFFKNDNRIFDPNETKMYNKVLERYCNYYDIFEYMVNSNNDLDIAYDLKDEVIEFYKKCTYKNAEKKLNEIIKDFSSSPIPEMISFSNTLKKWKYEIINSFIIVKEYTDKNNNTIKKKINNGIIENRNKSIKLLKHSSNGYLNWERFRNRILFSLNDDATFFMYPAFKPKPTKNTSTKKENEDK